MYTRALSGRKNALGAESMHTLIAFNDLGSLHIGQSRLAEAGTVHKRAPSENEKALGKERIDRIRTVNTLTSLPSATLSTYLN